MFIYLFGVLVLLVIAHILMNCNERARLLQKIPGPRYDFLFGNALVAIASSADIVKIAEKFSRTWNGIYRFWLYPYGIVVIFNPDDVETVMSNMKYTDKSIAYDILKPWLQDGLLISNGSKWQERRKILTPAFHFNILRQFFEIIVENSLRLAESLTSTEGQQIDIVPVLSEYTLNIICETAMGTQLSKDTKDTSKTYKQTIYELGYVFVKRFVNFYLYPDIIFYSTPIGRRQQRCLKVAHSFTENVIKQRKEYNATKVRDTDLSEGNDETYMNRKKRKTAMLDLLISAEKEGLIDNTGIQEEVDTFMFEGHDTLASALTFCFMSLANHKNIQDKVVEELNSIFEDQERPVKMEDLNKMQYMECCIKESMRIYPPVHFISRGLSETVTLSNYTVPKGTICHISIRDLHHRADLYEDPLKFDPDRFLPENSVGRHPYAYIPFSAGPRNCIGQKFAMMELKITITEILRNFKLEPVTRPEDIVIKPDLVLRHNGPVLIKLKKRKYNISNTYNVGIDVGKKILV